MAPAPIPFAVIGTGWITDSFVQGAHASGAWALSAVYSRSDATARSFAAKYASSITVHTSVADLAADRSVKAVYIASPNSLHYSHARPLLAAGKHVILEKPATSTPAELDELYRTAAASSVFLIEAFRHLHETNFLALRAALPRLGPIFGASLTYAQRSSRYDVVLDPAKPLPNIFNLDFSGGSLVDLGVYPISAAVALFGRPEKATYAPMLLRSGADGGGFVLLRYPTFAVQIAASKMYNSAAPTEVYGQAGTLVCSGVTDIEGLELRDAKTKEVTALGGARCPLNLQEEATEYARILNERDVSAAAKWESISRDTLAITSQLRHENGLLFKVERDAAAAAPQE